MADIMLRLCSVDDRSISVYLQVRFRKPNVPVPNTHWYTYIYVQAYIHVNRTMYTYVQTYKGRDGWMDGWMEERDEKYMHM